MVQARQELKKRVLPKQQQNEETENVQPVQKWPFLGITRKNLLVQSTNIAPGIARLHIFISAGYVENKDKTPSMQQATGSQRF